MDARFWIGDGSEAFRSEDHSELLQIRHGTSACSQSGAREIRVAPCSPDDSGQLTIRFAAVLPALTPSTQLALPLSTEHGRD